jgi:hypothetical protein
MLIQSNIRTAIFPGYYTGRATHIHTKVFPEWTVHPENGTFTPGRLAHVGQFFFEDDINMAVDKVCLSLPSVLPSFSPSLSFASFFGINADVHADVPLHREPNPAHAWPNAQLARLAQYIRRLASQRV